MGTTAAAPTRQAPDEVYAKDEAPKIPLHPEGQFCVACVDMVYLGPRLQQYQGQPPRISDSVVLVFWTGEKNPETGAMLDVRAEFSVSMGEKANLRKFLEAWRGKSYTEAQVKQGVPLHKLVYQYALTSVEHKPAKSSGRVYAQIKSISKLPDALPKPTFDFDAYVRDPFLGEKKKLYAAEVAKHRAESAPSHEDDNGGDPGPNDDDLPF